MFLSSYRNTSGSLGEQEILWEHEPQASVSTASSSWAGSSVRVAGITRVAGVAREGSVAGWQGRRWWSRGHDFIHER